MHYYSRSEFMINREKLLFNNMVKEFSINQDIQIEFFQLNFYQINHKSLFQVDEIPI